VLLTTHKDGPKYEPDRYGWSFGTPQVSSVTTACIFCGQAPTTREHVFPRWVGPILRQDPREMIQPGLHHIQSAGGTRDHSWTSSRLLNFVANCVCAKCNGGWMSEIEGAAKPIIAPMIMGQTTTLDTPAQETLAAWLGLKAIVTRYVHRPIDPVPHEWLDYYYVHHRPPDTWYEWVTGYNGKWPLYYDGHDITATFADSSDLTESTGTPHGVLASFVIGYFAAKVFGLRGGTPSEPGTKAMFRVLPSTGETFIWPPELHLDDASLAGFCGMYLT